MLQQYILSFTFTLSLTLSLSLSLSLLPLSLSRQNRLHNEYRVASNDHRDARVWRVDNSIDLSMASSPDSAI